MACKACEIDWSAPKLKVPFHLFTQCLSQDLLWMSDFMTLIVINLLHIFLSFQQIHKTQRSTLFLGKVNILLIFVFAALFHLCSYQVRGLDIFNIEWVEYFYIESIRYVERTHNQSGKIPLLVQSAISHSQKMTFIWPPQYRRSQWTVKNFTLRCALGASRVGKNVKIDM